jgi:nitrite reductase/ring-hydroxylating ferredoxin subunit
MEKRVGGLPMRLVGRAARRLCRYRRADRPLHVPQAIRRPVRVASLADEIAEGEIVALDQQRCAARVGGQLCVFSRHCPHAGGDLAHGWVEDGKVYCPQHGYGFDAVSGRGTSDFIRAVRVYGVNDV